VRPIELLSSFILVRVVTEPSTVNFGRELLLLQLVPGPLCLRAPVKSTIRLSALLALRLSLLFSEFVEIDDFGHFSTALNSTPVPHRVPGALTTDGVYDANVAPFGETGTRCPMERNSQ
jgi:hypothetical protein